MVVEKRLDPPWLPLLDKTDDASVQKLVEINVRKLSEIAAEKTSTNWPKSLNTLASFQIPSKYLTRGKK
jgi:hypothetical protein